jgi:hypothetical protein
MGPNLGTLRSRFGDLGVSLVGAAEAPPIIPAAAIAVTRSADFLIAIFSAPLFAYQFISRRWPHRPRSAWDFRLIPAFTITDGWDLRNLTFKTWRLGITFSILRDCRLNITAYNACSRDCHRKKYRLFYSHFLRVKYAA